jgi:hypothetical protein
MLSVNGQRQQNNNQITGLIHRDVFTYGKWSGRKFHINAVFVSIVQQTFFEAFNQINHYLMKI